MSVARRWLLLLGSNLERDGVVREALRQLGEIDLLEILTDIRRFPACGNSRGPYFNALAQWHRNAKQSDVVSRLKALERALGRTRTANDRIDVDIDILAFADDDGPWFADPHAVAKHEFSHAPVIALLREARIDLHGNTGPGSP